MKNTLKLFVLIGIFLSLLILSGCDSDTVGSNNGVTQLNTNGSFVATAHNQIQGTIFITDQNSNPVSGITSSNVSAQLRWTTMLMADTGVSGLVTISSGTQTGKNIAGAVTMDLSGSMGGTQITCMKNGVNTYVNKMGANDISEIIKFATTVQVVQAFTNDKTLLTNAVGANWSGTGGSTALYQSIYQSLQDINAIQSSQFIRSVIAFTDGGENASSISRAAMISYALTNGLPIYTIGLYDSISNLTSSPAKDLRNIADTTGGFYFWSNPTSCSNLNDIYNKISGQLAGSYNITINWQGNLPPAGTIVKAIITTTYNGLTSSFSKTYALP